MRLIQKLKNILKPHGKSAFFSHLPKECRVLDVGCGNDSPRLFKLDFPHGHYTGIDVSNYRQSGPILADQYILTSPEEFADAIRGLTDQFDAVVSSHNLEHCIDRQATVEAMAGVLKPGGYLYLSFPSTASINFPSRDGTLNFFDDKTHVGLPPEVDAVAATLIENGLEIIFSNPRYRPPLMAAVGMLHEPYSHITAKVSRGTWEYFGFEAIIWAKKQ